MNTAVRAPAAPPRRGSLRRLGGRPQPLVRLVCFPWCGAGASVYRKLAALLPDHVELLAVQLPGREDRFGERRLLRMEQVVEQVVPDLVAVFDRPLALFGHSMGALVAHEAARALRERTGREPHAVVVSGQSAPADSGPPVPQWHAADEEAFIANLRQMGGTPPQVLDDRKAMRALLPLLRADYEVLETYVPRPGEPLTCPLVVCAGDEDPEVSPGSVAAWVRHTTGPHRVHWFEGDHFYLSARPEALAAALQGWIAPGGITP
ncbi:MAG TPA: alpha/beta fold hydrolase [Longimicrobiaceae bacterium]|nr:alpha/beta fold hydrolase [Longimicrobiaceae bacterium]